MKKWLPGQVNLMRQVNTEGSDRKFMKQLTGVIQVLIYRLKENNIMNTKHLSILSFFLKGTLFVVKRYQIGKKLS